MYREQNLELLRKSVVSKFKGVPLIRFKTYNTKNLCWEDKIIICESLYKVKLPYYDVPYSVAYTKDHCFHSLGNQMPVYVPDNDAHLNIYL